MKNTVILGYMLPMLLLLAGCGTKFTVSELNGENDLGLFIKGQDILRFDEDRHQSGCNGQRNTFWITDDSMANYFIIVCSSFPTVGNTIRCDLVYTTSNDTKSRSGLSFEVTRYDESSGRIWLWNQSGRIGAVVKYTVEQ